MMLLKGKVVMITGASSGIGMACAKSFAALGSKLLLGARRLERLKTLAREIKKKHKVEIFPIKIDVTNYKALEKTISGLPRGWKEVEILINNAGLAFGTDKMFDADIKDWDAMIDTNVKGLLYMTRLFLPGMVERGRGHVINVASIAGFELYPGGSVYSASKAAVQVLSKSLRMDVLGKSIRVTNIDPGMTKTEFPLVRWRGDEEAANKLYEGIDYLSPEEVAEAIVFCATRPPHVNIGELLITPTDQISFILTHRKKS
jgi:3-hydroxy acid dehydrogenase / malonic semialdehyde reductase